MLTASQMPRNQLGWSYESDLRRAISEYQEELVAALVCLGQSCDRTSLSNRTGHFVLTKASAKCASYSAASKSPDIKLRALSNSTLRTSWKAPFFWIAVKELKLSQHSTDTTKFATYPHYV